MTRPLTDQRLAEIAARAEGVREYIDLPDDTDGLAGEDVPALIAEIRRQRTQDAADRAGLRDLIRRAVCEAWDVAHEEAGRLEEVAGIEAARGARCVAYRLRRMAAEEQPARQTSSDAEELAADAARRFARRLVRVERLCAGRPGYHTITVKALLTAMSEAEQDEEQQ